MRPTVSASLCFAGEGSRSHLNCTIGSTGNATVRRSRTPALFYIHNNQLWNYYNASTIYPVHVVNSTLSSQLPLQIVVGDPGRQKVVKGGSWRWQGTMLFYEHGSAHNSGVYYSCQDTNGLMGLFTYLTGSVFLLAVSAPAVLMHTLTDLQPRLDAPCSRCIASCGRTKKYHPYLMTGLAVSTFVQHPTFHLTINVHPSSAMDITMAN